MLATPSLKNLSLSELTGALSGHYLTLREHVRQRLYPQPLPASRRIRIRLNDARLGSVFIGGSLIQHPAERGLLVLVHGLGGSSSSVYLRTAAAVAHRLGISSLRVDLRGADGGGEDFYHASLHSDLEHLLESPDLREFQKVYLLGYSLGGHLCLSYAAAQQNPRVRTLCAVCPPLDLSASASAFDRRRALFYRHYVLDALKRAYAAFQHRHALPWLPTAGQARRIQTIRAWDDCIVAPRHGFGSAARYYAEASVNRRLKDIHRPTLLVTAAHDPMVPASTLQHCVQRLPNCMQHVVLQRAGHVGFPRQVDLGGVARGSLEEQVVRWLLLADEQRDDSAIAARSREC